MHEEDTKTLLNLEEKIKNLAQKNFDGCQNIKEKYKELHDINSQLKIIFKTIPKKDLQFAWVHDIPIFKSFRCLLLSGSFTIHGETGRPHQMKTPTRFPSTRTLFGTRSSAK